MRKLIVLFLFVGALGWLIHSIRTGNVSALPSGSSWHTEIVDSTGDTGELTSLVLDNNEHPLISYYDATNGLLRFAQWSGTNWLLETIDDMGANPSHTSTSLQLDSNGRPHIAYYDFTSANLKHAYWDGADWQIEIVENSPSGAVGVSLALDNNNFPHISYTVENQVKYAYWNNSSWVVDFVGSDFNIGHYTSIALSSSGNPHITYVRWDLGIYTLKHAEWDSLSSSWVVEAVDTEVGDGPVPLVIDSSGLLHIAYWMQPGLGYAYWSGSDWQIDVVNATGIGASLVLDSSDLPHVCYNSTTNLDLRYAFWDGANWQDESVDDSGGSTGNDCSLTLDGDEQPFISYFDAFPNNDLKFAQASSLNFQVYLPYIIK